MKFKKALGRLPRLTTHKGSANKSRSSRSCSWDRQFVGLRMRLCLLVLWAVVRADEFDDIDGDPYDLLGVPYDASEEAVKKAYRSLSRRWHPDKNPTNTRKATKQFAKLSRAYEIVNDRKSRRRFDAHARMRAGSPPPAFDFDNLKTSFFGAKKEDLPPGTKRTMFERGGFRSVGHVDERFVPSWTKRGTRKMTRVTTTTLPTGTVLAEAQDYELRNGEWYETSKPYAWHGPDEGGASGETSRLEPARALFLGTMDGAISSCSNQLMQQCFPWLSTGFFFS